MHEDQQKSRDWGLVDLSGKVITQLELRYPIQSVSYLKTKDRVYFEVLLPTLQTKKGEPAPPPHSTPINARHQILSLNKAGTDLLPVEVAAPTAYNAEPDVCSDGSIVFTSNRDGDLDLYVEDSTRLAHLQK